MKLRVLDLFSGIGGFSLGLERTGGFETIAFCEKEAYPRSVLAKHWPGVKQYEDVCQLTGQQLAEDGLHPEVICGGFPCQDLSIAGKGEGLAGERSGLWFQFARIIGEVRPQFVVVENVSRLRSKGLGVVLGNLAALGYDAEWHCIPASAVGAPHQRDRIWIIAYPNSRGWRKQRHVCSAVGDVQTGQLSNSRKMRLAGCARLSIGPGTLREWAHAAITGAGWWAAEPNVGRVVDGVSEKVDRRKRLITLGNAVVPRIPELIGYAILRSLQDDPNMDDLL